MKEKKGDNQVLVSRISKIIRGCRKILQLNQFAVANQLGIDQSALSRIERGKQTLTAPQWFEFCQMVNISPDCMSTGYVELNQKNLPNQQDFGIQLPARYSYENKIKTRMLIPLFEFIRLNLGEEKLNHILNQFGVDPDFFINLDSTINLNFVDDIGKALRQIGELTPLDFMDVCKTARSSDCHGSLRYQYDRITNQPFQLISAFVANVSEYEQYFHYKITDLTHHHIDLAISPSVHLETFKYRENSNLRHFFQTYINGFLNSFSHYGCDQGLRIHCTEQIDPATSISLIRVSA